MTMKQVLIVLACLAFLLDLAQGHARLLDPPSRASLWRVRSKAPKDQNDAALNCGGFDVQHGLNKGRCGVCGDAAQLKTPRPHEIGGIFGKAGVVKTYRKGETIEMTFEVVINHGGNVVFKVCPTQGGKEADQACLDARPLKVIEGTKSSSSVKVSKIGNMRVKVKLPEDLLCDKCVLQYTYVGADRAGKCSDGKTKNGCGPQAHYRACADISIQNGRSKRQVCQGVGEYRYLTGIETWCNTNCKVGYCPPTHCQCYLPPEEDEY